MTNLEKFEDKIKMITYAGDTFAIIKDGNGEPTMCYDCRCQECKFHDTVSCYKEREKWLKEEYIESKYVEPCPFEEGELVEVSDDNINWLLLFFSRINNDNEPYKYKTYLTNGDTTCTYNWKYCQKYGTLGGLVKENIE